MEQRLFFFNSQIYILEVNEKKDFEKIFLYGWQQEYLFILGIKLSVNLNVRREMVLPFNATLCPGLLFSMEEY